MIYKFVVLSLLAYFIGCICSGYYLTKFMTRKNLKDIGSGSLGATNTGRVLGRKGFIVVFLFDYSKGAAIVGASIYAGLHDPLPLVVSVFTVLGHIWPLQLGFKGGKGVSSFLGLLTVYNNSMLLIFIFLFIVLYIYKKSFTASGLIAIILLPVALFALQYSILDIVLIGILAAVITFAHRDHINQMRKKTILD